MTDCKHNKAHKASVYFASWRCCSIVAETAEAIPRRCPEHGEYLLDKPALVEWNDSMRMGVERHIREPVTHQDGSAAFWCLPCARFGDNHFATTTRPEDDGTDIPVCDRQAAIMDRNRQLALFREDGERK